MGFMSRETTEFQNYVQVTFRPIIRADKYVEGQYTTFITLCETFHAFYVRDRCVMTRFLSVGIFMFVANYQFS